MPYHLEWNMTEGKSEQTPCLVLKAGIPVEDSFPNDYLLRLNSSKINSGLGGKIIYIYI